MGTVDTLELKLNRLQAISVELQNAEDIQSLVNKFRQIRKDIMSNEYADLLAGRYRLTTHFLLHDLYGSEDLVGRMLDLQKAKSAMSKVLPEAMLSTVVKAVEFSILTLQLDMDLAEYLKLNINEAKSLSVQQYSQAVKSAIPMQQLRHQCQLVLAVGAEIESVVNKPFIAMALKMCRKPAKIMGLAALQDFLERGFHAFKSMRGSKKFFKTFEEREERRIRGIYE